MKSTHYLELHVIVFLWGFTAVLGVLIALPAVELVLYRTLGSAISIAILLKILKKPLFIDKKATVQLLSTGLIFAIHWIMFFWSAKISNVSVLLVGMSTVTFWTAILDPLMNGGKVRSLEIILGVVIVFGVYIVFRADLSYMLGFSMAIIAAICAAIFTVLNAQFASRIHHYHVMGYEMAGAFIGTLLFLPFYFYFLAKGQLQLVISPTDGFYIAVLVVVCTLYAYSASVKLMKTISPFMVNLTISLEPVYGILLALLIFGDSEKMNSNFYLGSAIILFAVMSYPLLNRFYPTHK